MLGGPEIVMVAAGFTVTAGKWAVKDLLIEGGSLLLETVSTVVAVVGILVFNMLDVDVWGDMLTNEWIMTGAWFWVELPYFVDMAL